MGVVLDTNPLATMACCRVLIAGIHTRQSSWFSLTRIITHVLHGKRRQHFGRACLGGDFEQFLTRAAPEGTWTQAVSKRCSCGEKEGERRGRKKKGRGTTAQSLCLHLHPGFHLQGSKVRVRTEVMSTNKSGSSRSDRESLMAQWLSRCHPQESTFEYRTAGVSARRRKAGPLMAIHLHYIVCTMETAASGKIQCHGT